MSNTFASVELASCVKVQEQTTVALVTFLESDAPFNHTNYGSSTRPDNQSSIIKGRRRTSSTILRLIIIVSGTQDEHIVEQPFETLTLLTPNSDSGLFVYV